MKQYLNTFLILTSFLVFCLAPVKAQPPANPFYAFVGSEYNSTVNLEWVVYSKGYDYKGFVVERSSDGKSYSSINAIDYQKADSNPTSELDFTYIDKLPLHGANYYRIKAVFDDGSFDFSPTILEQVNAFGWVVNNIYPNPATSSLTVSCTVADSGPFQAIVYDSFGKEVISESIQCQNGDNEFAIALSKLVAGNYYLKISADPTTLPYIKRFTKL